MMIPLFTLHGSRFTRLRLRTPPPLRLCASAGEYKSWNHPFRLRKFMFVREVKSQRRTSHFTMILPLPCLIHGSKLPLRRGKPVGGERRTEKELLLPSAICGFRFAS